jgi:hypothetical protein
LDESDSEQRPLGGGRADDDDTYYRGSYRRATIPYHYPGGGGNLFLESWTITGPYTGRGPKGYKRFDHAKAA